MNKKLPKQIENKLEKLHELLDQMEEVRIIDPQDPETWDSDTLYNLVEDLKEALKLLENQTGKQLDEFGEPLILEAGLCSLVDSYQAEDEEEDL